MATVTYDDVQVTTADGLQLQGCFGVGLNDDFTPMDFVVAVLETFFAMTRQKATQVMLHVHTRGKGICGVFTREVAETKVTQVNEFSRSHQHPLLCTMEKA